MDIGQARCEDQPSPACEHAVPSSRAEMLIRTIAETQDKSGYISNSKIYGKMGPEKSVHYKEVFTNQGCSLLEVSL